MTPSSAPTLDHDAFTLRRVALPPIPLDSGQTLEGASVAYHQAGALNVTRRNVVLVLHALTGDPGSALEWWRSALPWVGEREAKGLAVFAPNLIGSCYGSSGPARGNDGFPALTTRDIARAIGVFLERCGVRRVQLATGGSLGGMVTLELAASFPGLVERALVFAAPAAQGASAIGWGAVQRDLVRAFGTDGLAMARRVAMLTYRTPDGLAGRFGRRKLPDGRFEIQEWLQAHGARLVDRFDAASYLALLDAMDAHDVARRDGGAGDRLRASGTAFTGVGIPGDLLYPAEDVECWVRACGGQYREIHSLHGHDAFLLEREQVGVLLRDALGAADRVEVA